MVGVLSFDKARWIAAENKYLIRVQSLAKEFRRRYLYKFEKAHEKEERLFYGRASLRQLINPDAERIEKMTETVCEMMLRLTGILLVRCVLV